MNALEYWTVKTGYFCVFTILALPVWLALFGTLVGLMALHAPEEATYAVGFLGVIGMEAAVYRLAAKSAARRVSGGPFLDSLYAGAAEFRLELSFLPVVGRLFAPRGQADSK